MIQIIINDTNYKNKKDITFLIHTEGCESDIDNESLIFQEHNLNHNFYQMSTNYLFEHIHNEPEYVQGIGISAVSQEFMAKMWWDELKQNNTYLSHPMWVLENNQWILIEELSETFEWKNYPPTETFYYQTILRSYFHHLEQTMLNISRNIDNLQRHGDLFWVPGMI